MNLQGFPDFNADLFGGPFSASPYIGLRTLQVGSTKSDSVHFSPAVRGQFTGITHVKSDASNNPNIPVYLFGRGINYVISTDGHFFGKIRVGKSSNIVSIPVTNNGDDTTSIISIALTPDGDPQDFILDPKTLPSYPAADWKLDTQKSLKNSHSFTAIFSPKIDTTKNIVDTGSRFAVVKIATNDGNIYYDTLSGIGAEPWLVAAIPILDFGTITNPLMTSPAFLTKIDF